MSEVIFSAEEKVHYQEKGYWFPKRLFSVEETHQWLDELKAIEADLLKEKGPTFFRELPPWMGKKEGEQHPLEPWVRKIVWDPRLTKAAAELVPGDLLLRNVDLFVKEPHTKQGLLWHMDTEYGGEDPDGIVTVWIALTRSRHSNGALWFAPASHRRPEIPDLEEEDGAAVAKSYGPPVQIRLDPGEASFHHGRLLHTSGANQTPNRRIGLAVRFFGSDVDPRVAKCGSPVVMGSGSLSGIKFKENSAFPFTWWAPFDNR